ncbi:MAG: HAD family phosphatase [Candidatus Saccharimonas sp.]
MVKQKFAAFDIDGTLFRSGLYREVAYELMKMGALPHEVLEETTVKNREWRHRSHGNAFEEFDMLVVDRVDHLLPQLRIDDYEEAAQMVLEKRADNVYVYTRNLIKKLKDEGYFLIAISGSQIELVEPFAVKYGFDAWVGQEWERGDEFFTGNIIKTHTNKDLILRDLMSRYNLTLKDSYAVGDSNGDVGMLGLVEHPIAFNPTAELYDKAHAHGWTIAIERKNMMYMLKMDNGDYRLVSAEQQ